MTHEVNFILQQLCAELCVLLVAATSWRPFTRQHALCQDLNITTSVKDTLFGKKKKATFLAATAASLA